VQGELRGLGAGRVVVVGSPATVADAVVQGTVCAAPGLLAPGSFITIGRIETYGFAGHLGADWLDGSERRICPPAPGCGYWGLRNVWNDGTVEGGGMPVEPAGVRMGRLELYPDLQATKWGTNDNWDPALTVGGIHLWNPDGRPLSGLRLPHASNGAVRYVAPVLAGGVPVADGRFRSQVFQLVPKDASAGAFNIASSRGGQWTTGWIWPGTYELFFFDDATGRSIYVRAPLPLGHTIDVGKPCFGFATCTTLS
jgi:hypothetical protein